ncbi:hypothetical protein P7K49_023511 [Saguinus oedipus]|uniref:Uncharacterized protein n=1 Tax=Saguinus oedipus TaxID=9490 RepID=A0ABQ9ULV5_SAGOE|nr:hypothetical protein P7K49_023511 [Saguinus oedipus]
MGDKWVSRSADPELCVWEQLYLPLSTLGGMVVDGQPAYHSDTLSKAPRMNSLEQGMVGLKIEDISSSAVKMVGSVISSVALTGVLSGMKGQIIESYTILEKLKAAHSYNPKQFDWNLRSRHVFINKSYSEDDIHCSIKYSI